jgi:hypothetical protein
MLENELQQIREQVNELEMIGVAKSTQPPSKERDLVYAKKTFEQQVEAKELELSDATRAIRRISPSGAAQHCKCQEPIS